MHCVRLRGIYAHAFLGLKKKMHTLYPWQTKQWHVLLARWRDQKLPHALLFAGSKDLGKLDFAHIVAARLLCQTTGVANELACGTCQSCKWLTAQTHPDLFVVQPEEESKVIKIEQVRELLESLQQTAQCSSGQQIVILEPAEAMNKAAANALLKTLEEPSGHVVFLLVSHQPARLPATIRSRCQKMDFPAPPISSSLAWLKNQLPLEQNLAMLLAISENIPLRALAFAKESQLVTYNRLVAHFIKLGEGSLTPIEMASICAEMSVELVFGGIYLLLMDLIRIQQSAHSITHAHQTEALIFIANQVSSFQVFYFLDQLMAAKNQLNAKIPLNMLLLWEALFIEWAKFLLKNKNLSARGFLKCL